jgi:hypothetical protein
LPSLPAIYSTSEDTRTGVVSALAQQYQCMAQGKPITSSRLLSAFSQIRKLKAPKSITQPPQFMRCWNNSVWMMCTRNGWIEGCRCSGCGYSESFRRVEGVKITPRGENDIEKEVHVDQEELLRYHFKPNDVGSGLEHCLYPPIWYKDDGKSAEFTHSEILTHVQDLHTLAEIVDKGLVDRNWRDKIGDTVLYHIFGSL